MPDWSWKDAVSYISPLISLAGAAASWYWAKKKMKWDAGKELGALRADTIDLLATALSFGPECDVSPSNFLPRKHSWSLLVRERAPIMGPQAHRAMQEIEQLLDLAWDEAFDEDECRYLPDELLTRKAVNPGTHKKLSAYHKRLSDDRHFMSQ